MRIEGLLVSSVEMETPPQEGRVMMKIMRRLKKRTIVRKKRIDRIWTTCLAWAAGARGNF